jgi:hypothetical protein
MRIFRSIRWQRRFRLRSAFVLLAAIAAILAVMSHFRAVGIERRRVKALLESHGAVLSFVPQASGLRGRTMDSVFGPEITGVSYWQGTSRLDTTCLNEIAHLSGFVELTLDNAVLDEIQLGILRRVKGLRVLSADYTNLDDEAAETLASLEMLETLHLRNCRISDAGLENLSRLDHLMTLSVAGTQVTGKGVQFLRKLPALRFLDLSECVLSTDKNGQDKSSTFAGFATLEELRLTDSLISPADALSLRDSTTLKILDISGCGLDSRTLVDLTSIKCLAVLITDAELMCRESVLALRSLPLLQYLQVIGDVPRGGDGNPRKVDWIRVPLPSGSVEQVPVLRENLAGL